MTSLTLAVGALTLSPLSLLLPGQEGQAGRPQPELDPAPLTASQKRAAHPLFVPTWSLQALLPQLPLPWPLPPDLQLPPSPKPHYLSQYRPPDPHRPLDPARRAAMTDFEIALHLIDFSSLEPLLAQRFRDSAKGQVPYHPVSLFLAVSLRLQEKKSWRALARLLAGEHGGGWRRLLGFAEGLTPCASTLRGFWQALGPERFEELCPQMALLLHRHGLLPQRSTYPGDPPEQGVSLTRDGMLHGARSRPSCRLATNECYQPLAGALTAPPPAPAAVETERGTERPLGEETGVRVEEGIEVKVEVVAPPFPPLQGGSGGREGGEDGAGSQPTSTSPTSVDTAASRQPDPPGPPLPSPPTAGRPCRARQKGREGCACDTPACQHQCKRASRLDPEARYIHYAGHNHKRHHQHQDQPPSSAAPGAQAPSPSAPRGPASAAAGTKPPPLPKAQAGASQAQSPRLREAGRASEGVDLFGHRSVAQRILDDRFAVAWTVLSLLYPANTDERTIFVEGLKHLLRVLPWLCIGEWLDDSGVGYAECLVALYERGILRLVDIRADPTDSDVAACRRRHYDAQGRPLCPHYYPLYPNGYDHQRRRAKWVCRQRCQREPLEERDAIQPVADCPWLGGQGQPAGGVGYVVNVGLTMPDGSPRLARDIPYGSAAWKARYGRRNLAESRNGQVEGMGLKRLRSYGLPRDTKDLQMADWLIDLRTLGRLVREATDLRPD